MALFVGVMSGTSMDAVDSALVDFAGETPRLLATHDTAWPHSLRERLQALAAGSPISATDFAVLDADVGLFFAEAIDQLLHQSGTRAADVTAIGCHGQTVAHAPERFPPATLQLGDANIIAERTGITTVNDFRRRDMAAGGQGAPLAPAFHEAVLRHGDETRVVLNLGGIANITVLPKDRERDAIGFDTGPANCLMDGWIRQQQGKPFDADGKWAASASPVPDLLNALLNDPYFTLAPPKSTGTQYFSNRWLQEKLGAGNRYSGAEVQATLLALTSQSISDAIRQHAPGTERVLVCGGGAHNNVLMQRLGKTLGIPVEPTSSHGIDPEWMEAMAFAWLAQRTLAGAPGNLPSVTGAEQYRILGAVHVG